jgi:uncharacterized membrane protein YqhA
MVTLEQLKQLKKELVSNGRLSREEIAKLRESLFDDESKKGMNRDKGDLLFELKDEINRKHVAPEFDKLFIDGITSYLLEDEDSPGKIDEVEAEWLRGRMQKKGYLDKLDRSLLDELKRRAINCPEILNYKGRLVREFEKVLNGSRYLTLLAVVGSLLSAVTLFGYGLYEVSMGAQEVYERVRASAEPAPTQSVDSAHENLIIHFVSSIDLFLFAMVLIIFGMGIYELFISPIDLVEKKRDTRPHWLQISSIDDLKSSLGKVIIMVLIVSFFQHSRRVSYETAGDLLQLALAVVLIALSLWLAGNSHGQSLLRRGKSDPEKDE